MRKILFSLSLLAFTTTLFAQNCPPSSQAGIHIVQKGETLYTTPQPTTVSTTTYRPPTTSGGGTYIPPTATTAPAPPVATQPQPSTSADYTKGGRQSKPFDQYVKQEKGVHYAEANENMEGIAALYGYTAARFREFNGLPIGSEVFTGQVLRTTDCDCLNTITDGEDERVDVNRPSTTTGGYYLDGVWYSDDGTSGNGSNRIDPTTTTTTTTSDWTSTNPTTGAAPSSTTSTTTRPAPSSFNRSSAPYMRSEEALMIDEINLIRSNPSGYIPYVQEYIKYLQTNGSFGNSIKTSVEFATKTMSL